jgi:hypothetical protein
MLFSFISGPANNAINQSRPPHTRKHTRLPYCTHSRFVDRESPWLRAMISPPRSNHDIMHQSRLNLCWSLHGTDIQKKNEIDIVLLKFISRAACTKCLHNSSTIILQLFYDYSPRVFFCFFARHPSQMQQRKYFPEFVAPLCLVRLS